ncbi:hypothetical protein QJS10_CPA05g00937 [Acorus calamus]|uniref:1,4-alpha-D-glucan glucanohydrolase n=1 Tax=Acorus calamus TaxID=4465 RepID=A0AAV9EUJ7_ACOCL|nr:hypothetical protein QJS10_CPA05g00937 [Acorus calamus]
MSTLTSSKFPFQCLPHRAVNSSKRCSHNSIVYLRWQPQSTLKGAFKNKGKYLSTRGKNGAFDTLVCASMGEPNDTVTDSNASSQNSLSETRLRLEAIEKERDRLIEELARSEAKQKEYSTIIEHDKEQAVAELESARLGFNQRLQEALEEKFTLESKLVLAKEDAVELALQVEKLAEIEFKKVTSHILEDAQLRISAAETSAAEAAHQVEERIRKVTEETITSIVSESKDTLNKALTTAEQLGSRAKKALADLSGGLNLMDEIAFVRSQNSGLQNVVNDLKSQLLLTKNEVEKLKTALLQGQEQVRASELRATEAERALIDFQESARKRSIKREEEINALLDKVKKEAGNREKTAAKAFKAELEGIMAAVEAVKVTAQLKDQANLRRCEALQRSLMTSESALEVWKQRAEMAESMLQNKRIPGEGDEGVDYVISGGRIDLLTDDDALKWKLLADGPRREIPVWMARRIRTICPKFPPRKTNLDEALSVKSKSLKLPKLEEVWSIAQEKPKETDVLIEHVIEKEVIEKKRKALERALQRRTIKWKRTPEETKLEPGTGTGREIVFQGFHWESCRRKWYQELAPKAADLSQSGMTAVWLPPPTQSVAPQGYMPSDLYNLNSAYGTEDELKQCIDEMHTQDLLALGDVVLNHRCAQKQHECESATEEQTNPKMNVVTDGTKYRMINRTSN